MPRVAIFADVHGNIPAFEAVLADMARQHIDEVLAGGDLVGRGPCGRAAVSMVRAQGWRCVRGNHEDYLLNFRRNRIPSEWWSLPHWSASRWMAAELDEPSTHYMEGLPLGIEAASVASLHLFHGSPLANDHGLGPWSTDEDLSKVLGLLPEGSLLACGHTHRSMDRAVGSGRVVNVGSVGLPFNGDTRAQYAVISRRTHDGPWEVELRAVPYDLAQIFDLYERSGFLSAGGITSRMLRMELERARPFLVPFLRWADAFAHDPSTASTAEFLSLYDPDAPTEQFYQLLATLRPDYLNKPS